MEDDLKKDNEELMTIEECARYLKTSISTIYRLAQEKKTCIKGRKLSEIRDWLKRGGMAE